MKTIEQLLFLSKNPYYKLSPEEQQVLEDFLLKKQESESESFPKKNSKRFTGKIPVTVRNIVPKVDTYAPEADEKPRDAS